MATTTTSNRRKSSKAATAPKAKVAARKTTKTTKRAVSTSAKTASKAVKPAKPVTTVKTSVSSRSLSPLDRLRSMHVSAALMYAVFAGLIIGFVSTAATAVTLGIQTRDEFASSDHVVLGPAQEVLYNINPKYVLGAALLLAALASLLFASKLRPRYEATVTARISGFRWVTLGVTTALTLTFVNLLAGVHDLAALKLSAAFVLVTALLAWITDRDNVGARQPKWLVYIISLFTGALAWLPLVVSLIGTSLYGMERYGWHVYAIAAATLFGCAGFALTQYLQIRARGIQKDAAVVEQSYWRIELLSKFAVVLIVLLALQ